MGAVRVCAALAALALSACGQPPPPSVVVAGYQLGAPVRSLLLPPQLREISAVLVLDGHTLGCLQDEKGAIFVLDLRTNALQRTLTFGPRGDYEGLALGNGVLHVLRSDGTVLRLRSEGEQLAIADATEAVPKKRDYAEFEGLCWDPVDRRFLLAPKGPPADGRADHRTVYALDGSTLAVARQPVLDLRVSDVLAQAKAIGAALPTRITGKGHEKPDLKLHFSEVAVHPTTGDCWLLSSPDRVLLVVGRDGALRGLHAFAQDELPQPEGLAFLPSGELVIASEGRDGPGVVRLYGPVGAR